MLRKAICPHMRTQCSRDECLAFHSISTKSPEVQYVNERDERFAFTRKVEKPTGRILDLVIGECRLGLFRNLLLEMSVDEGFKLSEDGKSIIGTDGKAYPLEEVGEAL